jgi:hypothetical protein
MPSALRDPKTLAEWIELDYFQRPRPYRRLKRSIFWATFLGAIVVTAWTLLGGKRTVYEAGPVSTAHAMFNNECERCHSESFQPLYRFLLADPHVRSVSDDTCRSCHAGSVHHGNALAQMVPDCAGCHREHRGRALLARVPDGQCTACHADLKTIDGKLTYSQRITDWNANHPAFGRWRGAPLKDPGTIRFSHEAHLVPGGILDIDRAQWEKQREKLQNLGGVSLEIPDPNHFRPESADAMAEATDIEHIRAPFTGLCRAAVLGPSLRTGGLVARESAAAPFTGLLAVGLEPLALWQAQESQARNHVVLECVSCHQLDPAGRYMLPIRYDQHCQQCHPLSVQLVGEWKNGREREIASAFSKKPAPHPTPAEGPETVRAALRERLTELIQNAPGLVGAEGLPASRPVPGSRRAEPLTGEQWDWTNRQLGHLERVLFDGAGGCQYCHQEVTNPERRPNGLPAYRVSAIPSRWFPHGVFRHDSHRMLTCGECHPAANSKQSSDVLMPAIDNCRACHNSRVGARTDCAECHMYHNVEGKQQFRGIFTMDQSTGGKALRMVK